MSAKSLEQAVEQAIQGGCTVVQLREKYASSREFFETAQRVKQITDSYHIPLIINDRTDICLAVNAAGIHIGQQDLPAKIVRSMVGPDKIIGVSAATLSEAIQAEQDGADYLSGRHVCYLHKNKYTSCYDRAAYSNQASRANSRGCNRRYTIIQRGNTYKNRH